MTRIIKFTGHVCAFALQSLDLCHFVIANTRFKLVLMPALTFVNHLLNLLVPALFLAVLLALGARLAWRQATPLVTLWEQMLLNAVVGTVVMGGALALWGQDGLLGTYALLVLVMASCQWLLLRGWRV